MEDEGKELLERFAKEVKQSYRESVGEELCLRRDGKEEEANTIKQERHNDVTETLKFFINSEPFLSVIHFGSYRPDLVIEADDEGIFYNMFHCRRFWVELEIDSEVEENKLFDLKRILSHEWSILIINKDGSYRIEKPLAWEKAQELKNSVSEL